MYTQNENKTTNDEEFRRNIVSADFYKKKKDCGKFGVCVCNVNEKRILCYSCHPTINNSTLWEIGKLRKTE